MPSFLLLEGYGPCGCGPLGVDFGLLPAFLHGGGLGSECGVGLELGELWKMRCLVKYIFIKYSVYWQIIYLTFIVIFGKINNNGLAACMANKGTGHPFSIVNDSSPSKAENFNESNKCTV